MTVCLCDFVTPWTSPPDSSVHRVVQGRILEWFVIPFSRGSSWPRDWTWVSCIAGRFFTIWATRETLPIHSSNLAGSSNPWYLPKGVENLRVHKNLHSDVTAALFITAKNLEANKMSSVGKWIICGPFKQTKKKCAIKPCRDMEET